MGITIKLKRTATSDKEPDINSLELGEIAINTFDGRIFMKTYDGSFEVKRIISEQELKQKLENGDYNVPINPDSLNLVFGDGLEVDDNVVKVKVGNDLTFDENGALIIKREHMELTPNWRSNLSVLEQYTYNIRYDGDDYHIADGGRDVYDNGNYIKVNDVKLGYSSAIYRSGGFLLFELNDVFGIKFWGNLGADGEGQIEKQDNLQLSENKEIYTSYKVVQNGRGGDPAVHHIVFSNEIVSTHKVASSTDNDYDEYLFSKLSKVYLMVMWSNSTVAWDNGNIPLQNIFTALFG